MAINGAGSLLLSLTLFGDVVISALITSVTDRIGRRRMLMLALYRSFRTIRPPEEQ